jgi:glycerophosphoryl diester phosphodiesterase
MHDLRSSLRADKRPLVIGHRGASGRLPENTLAAFRGAFEDGADGIELDVRLSADGVPVVVHDATTFRTTGIRWRVADRTASELAEVAAVPRASRHRTSATLVPPRMRGEFGIPALHEVLDVASDWKGIVYVELKGNRSSGPDLERAVVTLLRRRGEFERIVVLSFNHAALRRIKQSEPRIRTAATIAPTLRAPRPSPERVVEAVDRALADTAALHVSLATTRRVEALRSHAKGIVVWTVNSPLVGRLVAKRHVDALMTDFPHRFVAPDART